MAGCQRATTRAGVQPFRSSSGTDDGLSEPVHGSAEWIKAEQAKVSAGKAAASGSGCGKWVGIGCGIPVALILIFMIVASVWPRDNEPNGATFVVACENLVEAQLKSPSTAQFNSEISETGPYVIRGYVDAENALGGTVRADFQCTSGSAGMNLDYLTQR